MLNKEYRFLRNFILSCRNRSFSGFGTWRRKLVKLWDCILLLCHHRVFKEYQHWIQPKYRHLYPLRRSNVEQISFFIPSEFVDLETSSVWCEYKWPIFINHPNETRAPRTAIKPKHNRIIIRITLRIKENIMKSSMSDVEIA